FHRSYRVTVILIYLPFVYYRYRSHRDLPSFPTRRSSDLSRGVKVTPPSTNVSRSYDASGDTRCDSAPALGRIPLLGLRRTSRDTDRKSTRLNSSHVKTSYAVFCLTKKRQICHQSQHPSRA